MTLEQCIGNYNHVYEWKLNGMWYPCHILPNKEDEFGITIFTRNGSINSVPINNVRKMSKETYLYNRKKCIDNLREHTYELGFHKDIKEDIRIFEKSKDLELIELKRA